MVLCLILTKSINAQNQQNQLHDVVPLQLKKAALEDFAQQPPIPGNYYYLYDYGQSQNRNENLLPVLSFVLASTSVQQILDYVIPKEIIPSSLYRIDLQGLKWSQTAFQKVLSQYPYDPQRKNPLYIRADWLLSQLTDTSQSNAYYLLLYNAPPSKLSRDAILSQWGVSNDPKLSFGLIENDSGVALSKSRILQNLPVLRGYAWGTLDSIKSDPFIDPVPPFTQFKHDAEEWIIGAPKFVLQANPPIYGNLQYYFLATSQGQIINAADPKLVEDKSRFKNNPQIRTPGSCIQCHSQGLNYPNVNALRQLIEKGADVYADKNSQEQLELFHLLPAHEEIKYANTQFQKIQRHLTGLSSEEFLEAFRSIINEYEKPLSLEKAGKEVNFDPPLDFKFALGAASNSSYTLDARLVGLAHDIPISRQNWEKQYYNAVNAVKIYKKEPILGQVNEKK